jgi:DNA-directed RNA polymerase beta' subunit
MTENTSQGTPQDTSKNMIEGVEEKVRSNNSLSETDKTELLSRLSTLKDETQKDKKDSSLIKKAIDSLSDSVKKFEVSHPVLVEDINYIASSLANMGI